MLRLDDREYRRFDAGVSVTFLLYDFAVERYQARTYICTYISLIENCLWRNIELSMVHRGRCREPAIHDITQCIRNAAASMWLREVTCPHPSVADVHRESSYHETSFARDTSGRINATTTESFGDVLDVFSSYPKARIYVEAWRIILDITKLNFQRNIVINFIKYRTAKICCR